MQRIKSYFRSNLRRSVVGLFATMILLIPWGISPVQNLGISIYLTICIIPIYALLDYVVDKWYNVKSVKIKEVSISQSTLHSKPMMQQEQLDVSSARVKIQLR